jgi:hypothetical protein
LYFFLTFLGAFLNTTAQCKSGIIEDFLDRKDSLEDGLLEGRQYFQDDSAVKMTFMTLLTVKGDNHFVEVPKNVEFQRLRT